MKKTFVLILIIAWALILSGCSTITGKTIGQEVVQNIVQPKNVHEVILQIEGMTCTSCALGVESQLKQVDGVVDAKVDYTKGIAIVTFDKNKVDAETIAKASTVYSAKIVK